ncbi:MAG: hypothetical protein Q9M50_14705 [Methylococcales bacterium]|nr:hypothetical protein [Methylococcales bacterium]
MVFGGIISILIAIWIFRTARDAKTGNTFYWVAGSVVLFLVVQTIMIYFNAMIIEIFDGDVSTEYDNAGGLNSRDNSDTAGLQSGTGGTLIGIIFELLPFMVSFFVIAVLRLLVMLKQPFGFMSLFGGIKETFVGIGDSFKISDEAAVKVPPSENEDTKE